MKQNITIKPELKIKQSFNSQKEQSLKILSYNAKNLKEYLFKQAQINPFLTYTAEADAFLEYDHTTQSLYDKIEAELKSTNQTIPEDLYQYLISQLDSNGYFKTLHSLLAIPKNNYNRPSTFFKEQSHMDVFVEI